MRVAVYTISKNEEQFVERWCKSASEADEVVLVDTGSTDNTVSVARSLGAIVHQWRRWEWSRNYPISMELG